KLKSAPSYLEDLIERDIVEDIQKIAVGEEKWKAMHQTGFTPWERIVSQVITGDFFGADRIDYLLRDAKSTGVAYGLFDYHQLIEMLRILPSADRGSDELLLGIDENGLESCEALLLARHFMHRRIYQYSSVKAYNFHLRRYMQAVFFQKMMDSVDAFLSVSDTDVISALNKAAKDPSLPGHKDARCVIFRQHRFRAVPLPETMIVDHLKQFKKNARVSDADFEWEFTKETSPLDRLCFPVARRHIVIQKARECSELLVKVATQKSNWAYVTPEKDHEFATFLESESWTR
ncbi:MAG: hypothetical protein RL235_884, partial [Chlamydiota bacterium]